MFASQREEIEFQEEKKVSKERARTYKNQVSKAAKEAALLSKLVESKRKHIKRLKKLAKAIKHARVKRQAISRKLRALTFKRRLNIQRLKALNKRKHALAE
ncbi:hypothetical protein ONZ45_g17842 [Pleurotus djamor]|nr:hypothetical protein ONZ45_g17842 [Pleurotus djamor]